MYKVLITGATGFIGSHVVRLFCEKGVKVNCLVRKTSDLSNIKDLQVKLIYGDITDLQGLIQSFKGFDSVIHIAAYVHDWGNYDVFYKTNVIGTLNVLQSSYENNINNIIITGSISVYGEEDSKVVKNENSPYNSHYPYFGDKIFPSKFNFYRDTKAIAQKEAIKFATEHNLNMTIIEPVWVYGEREFNTGFFEYIKTIKTGIPFFPGSKKNKFHVVYAQDLARAYWLAFQKKLMGINSFIIGNEKAEQMDKIFSLFCREAGLKKPKNLHKFIAYPIGFLWELLYTILYMKNPPLLARNRVNLFYDNIEYSTLKAKILLEFTNLYSLEEGIKKTVVWYKEQKLI